LRRCHNHDFDDLTQIHIFRNGLQHQPKLFLDVAAGGSLMSKSAEDAIAIIERMALSDHQGQYNKSSSQRNAGIIEHGATDAMLAQNKILAQALEELTKQLSKLPQQLKEILEMPSKPKHVAYCELCNGDHATGYCPPSNEEVNYMENQQKQGQYQGNTGYQRGNNPNYGQGWRHDAGLSNIQHQYENYNQNPPQHVRNSRLEDTLFKFEELTMVNQQNTYVSIKNIETQLGQMAKQMVDMQGSRSPPPHSQPNSTEHESFIGINKKIEVIEEFGEENVVENKEEEGLEECGTMHILKITKPHMTQLPYSWPCVHEENNEGEKEKLVEKEEESSQERVKVNKAEIDKVVEFICALFHKQPRRRMTWIPHQLYFKFMEFLPNKLKSKDDVLSVSFWPP
jgi:hypothetical protein